MPEMDSNYACKLNHFPSGLASTTWGVHPICIYTAIPDFITINSCNGVTPILEELRKGKASLDPNLIPGDQKYFQDALMMPRMNQLKCPYTSSRQWCFFFHQC